jgi:SAM-dependent methyltransferase
LLRRNCDKPAQEREPQFLPSSAGTIRDLRERTNLAQAIAFFGSHPEASRFVDVCLSKTLADLPEKIHCVDFGGGQGIVAHAMQQALLAAGRQPHVMVVDSNANYLSDARARGLSVQLANIESCAVAGLDLSTMRLVNHYCSCEQQGSMLANIYKSLRPNGMFVSQIETGAAEICRLQGKISNALSNESCSGYYWPTLNEYIALAEAAGFVETCVIGESPPVEATFNEALATAWKRFHGRRLEDFARDGRIDEMNRLLAERAQFFKASHLSIAQEWGEGTGSSQTSPAQGRFQLHYPIVYCRRTG